MESVLFCIENKTKNKYIGFVKWLLFLLNNMKNKIEKSELLNSPILNIKWNNILLVWNWWYRNLWDELILLWNVKLLLNQWKKVTIVCYDPDRLRKFFTQFIDVGKVKFIHELPKWFR